MGKNPIVSVTYENERISIKKSLAYIKCVLLLSCGRFMGCTSKRFSLSIQGFMIKVGDSSETARRISEGKRP